MGVCVRVNNFYKTTRPRDMLFLLKDTLSMAGFDLHGFCAHCRDKKEGKDPCVEKPGSD